jgi:hypothetical protein
MAVCLSWKHLWLGAEPSADRIRLYGMSDLFRLTTIRFRAGAVPGAPPTELPVPYVTVIAGPNNSGKSLLLREIDQWGAGGQEPPVSPWPGAEVVSSIDAI